MKKKINKKKVHYVFFDATCTFCLFWAYKILKWDKKRIFFLTPLKGKAADTYLCGPFAFLAEGTSLVLLEGAASENPKAFRKGKAVFRVLWLLGGAWRLLGWLCYIPSEFSCLYAFFAYNRHLLGRFLKENISLEKIAKNPRFLP